MFNAERHKLRVRLDELKSQAEALMIGLIDDERAQQIAPLCVRIKALERHLGMTHPGRWADRHRYNRESENGQRTKTSTETGGEVPVSTTDVPARLA